MLSTFFAPARTTNPATAGPPDALASRSSSSTAAAGTLCAQQYVISTCAGGPVATVPVTAANAAVGLPQDIATDAARSCDGMKGLGKKCHPSLSTSIPPVISDINKTLMFCRLRVT